MPPSVNANRLLPEKFTLVHPTDRPPRPYASLILTIQLGAVGRLYSDNYSVVAQISAVINQPSLAEIDSPSCIQVIPT